MDKEFYILNRSLLSRNDVRVSPSSTSHLYGQSIFTSFVGECSNFPFLDQHIERVVKGACFLWPTICSKELIVNELKIALKILEDCYVDEYLYCRITCWIETDNFGISSGDGEFKILLSGKKRDRVNSVKSFKLKSVKMARDLSIPPFVKAGSYLAESLILRDVREYGFDDVLFIGKNNNITECTTSSFFYLQDGVFYTPPLSSEVLDGITRFNLIKYLKFRGKEVIIKNFTRTDLDSIDAAFVTNAVSGITVVSFIDNIKLEQPELLLTLLTDFVNDTYS